MNVTRFTHLFQSLLARRIITALILFSVFVIMSLTAWQMKSEYDSELRKIEQSLSELEKFHLAALVQSTWSTNEKEVYLQLQGIVNQFYIEHAAVIVNGKVWLESGRPVQGKALKREYTLEYSQLGDKYNLGTLIVEANLDKIWIVIKEQAVTLLVSNAILIFLISGFIFVLLDRMVTRHLIQSANYVYKLDPNQALVPLKLSRSDERKNDEIQTLVNAINQMQANTRSLLLGLKQSEEEFRAIADYTYDWESWHNPDGSLRWVNPAVRRMTGYDADECFDMQDYPIPMIAEAEQSKARKLIHEIMRFRSNGNEHIFPLVKKNGEKGWIAMSWQPIYSDKGEYLGIRMSTRDITDRKNAEEERERIRSQLLQSQKMESIGHLTGGIAHDFNNMLGVMLGYTELLSGICDNMMPAQNNVKKYINEILIAGNRAKELISQMLIFSRLNPESNDKDTPELFLAPIVKEVIKLLRSSIPTTIDLSYQISEEQLRARIQPVQLHQILLNLGINARDAIGEYGTIDIRLSGSEQHGTCKSCHQNFHGEYAVLTVSDSGAGIPEERLAKIFDPFFTTKEVGKGSGMGLSVVHGIVHSIGGHIVVDSKPDKGTKFQIFLPLASADASQRLLNENANYQASRVSLLNLNILVVDDEVAITTMLKEGLQQYGAKVEVQNSALGALSSLVYEPERFDLVISDVSMPEYSGLHMARAILQLRPQLPILLCTGFSEHVDEMTALKAGVTGFMKKPVKISELVQWIDEYFYQNQKKITSLG